MTPKLSDGKPLWKRPLLYVLVVVAAVIAVIIITTTVLPIGADLPEDPKATGASEGRGADPVQWANDNYEAAVAIIEEKAVDWPDLITAITADPDAAGAQYGQREEGAKDFSYSTLITGTLVEGPFGQLSIIADGTPAGTTVGFQVGPGINGAAFRDATGMITFGVFTNQNDYQQASLELNNKIKESILANFDADTALGNTYTITGAFTWAPSKTHALLTPVKIEAA